MNALDRLPSLRAAASLCTLAVVAAMSTPLNAQQFPTKEVQILIPYAPGGATDLVFRALAASSQKYLGQAVVVVNRAGGGGAVGFNEGAQAKPDGYTLTTAVTPLAILPHQVKTTFSYQNFAPIINVVQDPAMLQVQAAAPWKTTKEFVDYARQNPNTITVGNSGAGGGVHLIAAAFEHAIGAKFNHIPFAGGGPSVTALLGGHVNAVSVSPPEGIAHVKAGKLKIIALFSDKRMADFPDVPTVREQGIDFSMSQWRGLAAPKGTPPEIIKILHDAFKKGMEDPTFIKSAESMSVTLSYVGPADFGKLMAADHERYAKLVAELKK
ncbi:tripartite tricarboxylate transporter substrate binding protein [Xanthobacteraceae bacterium Astr-EGSB]|uniref:Bug family tripartite tricarboxylate transporter substrate binding protein n=1 Tax=Astrobacterium formosum TaxID=3069710 RepID=UPI0027AE40D2|nr:tripartite tricarboxylate transporter substrate binding protein [Xanthobacteraceae bacterium Astr-EGSB]